MFFLHIYLNFFLCFKVGEDYGLVSNDKSILAFVSVSNQTNDSHIMQELKQKCKILLGKTCSIKNCKDNTTHFHCSDPQCHKHCFMGKTIDRYKHINSHIKTIHYENPHIFMKQRIEVLFSQMQNTTNINQLPDHFIARYNVLFLFFNLYVLQLNLFFLANKNILVYLVTLKITKSKNGLSLQN